VAAGTNASQQTMSESEQSMHALQLIATVLGHDPAPSADQSLSFRERVVLAIACDALGLDDPVL
jgi:hypothetical protein